MILTCPKCATRFFADDHAVGAAGRQVECGVCGAIWSSASVAPAPSTSPDPGFEPAPVGGEAATPVAAPLFVERVAPSRKTGRKAVGRAWPIALLALAFVVVVVALSFQQQIEQALPGSTAIYHALGM